LAVRLLWVLPLAVGLPLLMVWGSARFGRPTDPSPGALRARRSWLSRGLRAKLGTKEHSIYRAHIDRF